MSVGVRQGALPLERLMRKAAVALVLCPNGAGDRELLLIRRSLRRGDPWSGDVALPGGRMGPGDPDTRATAVRETSEEVGLDLASASWLGELPHRFALAHNRPLPMAIVPHVFAISPPAPALRPNDEVAGVLWTPLSELRDPSRRAKVERKLGAITLRFDSIRDSRGNTIWGLTLMMIESLLAFERS